VVGHEERPGARWWVPENLSLPTLRAGVQQCQGCELYKDATQGVMGSGPEDAELMVVGEQPGDKEDQQGAPFVGPAGRLLDRALAELCWSRGQVYVTNAVKHFKYELRGKRRMHKTPAQREVEACRHWLEDEIARVEPRAFLALGATAARALLQRTVAVMRERGQWHDDAAGRPVLVALHPSALLRGDPAQREAAWKTWLKDLSLASGLLSGR
jgi:uracil-DNA glycosylase family protein